MRRSAKRYEIVVLTLLVAGMAGLGIWMGLAGPKKEKLVNQNGVTTDWLPFEISDKIAMTAETFFDKFLIPGETPQEVWLRISPALTQHSLSQQELMKRQLQAINSVIARIESASGIEAFADAVTGFNSVLEIVNSDEYARQYIVREFTNGVVDARDLTRVLDGYMYELHNGLTELDGQLLVDCQLDLEFKAPEYRAWDFSDFHQSIDASVGDLVYDARAVWGESIVSGTIGFGVGMLIESVVNSLGPKNEYGDPTISSRIGSGVTGFGGGWAAEEMISGSMTGRSDLIANASGIKARILTNLRASDQEQGNFWGDRAFEIVMQHELNLYRAIAERLGLPWEWVEQNYPACE